MAEPDRDTVLALAKTRRLRRLTLLSDLRQAQHDLQPRVLVDRWAQRQRGRIGKGAIAARQAIVKHAPLFGVGSAAILLFAARRPILNMIQRLRDGRTDSEEEMQ